METVKSPCLSKKDSEQIRTFGRQMSRRGVLKILGLSAALALTGCDNNPELKDYMKSLNELEPYMAAGAVIIGKYSPSKQEVPDFNYIGHGGIYEKGGRLWLATVEHVKNEIKKDETMVAIFPGINKSRFLKIMIPGNEAFATFSKTTLINDDNTGSIIGYDKIVAHPLDDYNADLNMSIGEGKIKPLKLSLGILKDTNP